MKNSIIISCIIVLFSFFSNTHLSAINSSKVKEVEKYHKLTGKKARRFIKKYKHKLDSLLQNDNTVQGSQKENSTGNKLAIALLVVVGIVVIVIIVVYLLFVAFLKDLASLFFKS